MIGRSAKFRTCATVTQAELGDAENAGAVAAEQLLAPPNVRSRSLSCLTKLRNGRLRRKKPRFG
jgi:hypothetical protein